MTTTVIETDEKSKMGNLGKSKRTRKAGIKYFLDDGEACRAMNEIRISEFKDAKVITATNTPTAPQMNHLEKIGCFEKLKIDESRATE